MLLQYNSQESCRCKKTQGIMILVLSGMLWHCTDPLTRSYLARHGTSAHGAWGYGPARHGLVWHVPVWHSMAHHGLARPTHAWHGTAWHVLARGMSWRAVLWRHPARVIELSLRTSLTISHRGLCRAIIRSTAWYTWQQWNVACIKTLISLSPPLLFIPLY